MKKILFILFFSLLGLSGCVNNGDEPDQPVIPQPEPPVNAAADDLIGTWETYYYKKDIIYIYSPGEQQIFPGLRLVDYDGYRTEFYLDPADNKYKFKSYNVIDHLNDEGTYSASSDTIYFKFTYLGGVATDTTTKQIIRRLDPSKGILKTEDIYPGTIANTGMKFIVTDMKAQRNVAIAPTFTDVSKVMVNTYFDELSEAPWDVKACAYYYNGLYQPGETAKMEEALTKTQTSYRFYKDAQGKKFCVISSLNPETNEIEADKNSPYPIIIVDDVIYFFYTDKVTGEMKDFAAWVTEWKTANGARTYIDKRSERLGNDISAIVTRDLLLVQRKN
ncbi:hypothetical protein [Dysgonomonas termitidis]|uniref:Lipocalin-like domain-containing protein n=1 Tax=Dysgonomonas termitidis TaxID=1516126 RepID=A0ABV9L021_9BACT